MGLFVTCRDSSFALKSARHRRKEAVKSNAVTILGAAKQRRRVEHAHDWPR